MPEYAEKVYHELKKRFKVFYDESGAVGRRYARMDEAGTPYCVTVDGQTLQDDTMTLRERRQHGADAHENRRGHGVSG